MSRKRLSKIAQLALYLRNRLNQMIQDGKSGKDIVAWVNSEDVGEWDQDMKMEITEQNLSTWRAGGYQDWLKQQAALELVKRMTEDAGELGAAADGEGIADRFAAYLTVEMTRLGRELVEKETEPAKRWEQLKEVSRELSRSRRDDHRAMQVKIARQKWDWEQEQVEERKDDEQAEDAKQMKMSVLLGPFQVELMAPLYGVGAKGRYIAAMMLELKDDLPEGMLSNLPQYRLPEKKKRTTKKAAALRNGRTPAGANPDENPGQSNQIAPNPTHNNEP